MRHVHILACRVFGEGSTSGASHAQDIADGSRESPNEPYGCPGRLQGKYEFRECCEP